MNAAMFRIAHSAKARGGRPRMRSASGSPTARQAVARRRWRGWRLRAAQTNCSICAQACDVTGQPVVARHQVSEGADVNHRCFGVPCPPVVSGSCRHAHPPIRRRSCPAARTGAPSASSPATRWRSTFPVAPVTRITIFLAGGWWGANGRAGHRRGVPRQHHMAAWAGSPPGPMPLQYCYILLTFE